MFIHVGEGEERREQGGGGDDLERKMAEMATKVNCIHIRIHVLIRFYIMCMCICMHVRMAARGIDMICVPVYLCVFAFNICVCTYVYLRVCTCAYRYADTCRYR